jgi:MFS family permease
MQSHRWSDYSPLVWRLFTFTVIVGITAGLPEIIFNFYLLSLGFDNAVAGQMASLVRISGFIFGIPLGLAVDRFGGVRVIQLAGVVNIITWAILLTTTDITIIRACYLFSGVLFTAQATAILPMLTRVTTPDQRPLLFGINFALVMATSSISALLGGALPGIIAEWQGFSATSTEAYRTTLYAVFGFTVLTVLSLSGLHKRIMTSQVNDDHHVDRRAQPDILVAKSLILRRALGRITLGMAGGVIHPFINLYLRQSHNMPDEQIGATIALFGFASMLAGLLSGYFTNRFGAQRTVVWSAAGAGIVMLSAFLPNPIVFVVAYTIGMALIGQIYPAGDILILNTVAPAQRGFTTSINNMYWSLGWAVAAGVSGMLQVTSGFFWPIALHIMLMGVTALLFWGQRYPVYQRASA